MASRDLSKIDTIIVHCSATPPDMDVDAGTIRRWHISKGWTDIGYHYVIRRSGDVEEGRDIGKVGAHAKGHNTNSVGICLAGGTKQINRSKSDANFTANQYHALRTLISDITKQIGRGLDVIGHREVNPGKACPCFDVQAFMEE